MPGPVDFDDLAADQVVHEERLRVFERGGHEQRAAKLVGRLPGVHAFELDQVPPLKGPGAANFELADARGRDRGAVSAVPGTARADRMRAT